METVVVKVGGSAITWKSKVKAARVDAVKAIARELRKASSKARILLVHGAGSFGHPIARRYGITTSSGGAHGVAETRLSLLELSYMLLKELNEAGVKATLLSPMALMVARRGRIDKIFTEPIARLLDHGIMPVLHGDVVSDLEAGFTVVSGDQIACRLAVELKASRVVFGVDVDGVLDERGGVVRELSLSRLSEYSMQQKAPDVTGGMAGKLMEAKAALEAGIPVVVGNAVKPGVLSKMICGEPVRCTLVTL
ncbi:MAG: uridylate kinase [Thermoproteota archaeon]|nr:MAG: uridylate kinase [Candidatus Korarchaeota archaeon]